MTIERDFICKIDQYNNMDEQDIFLLNCPHLIVCAFKARNPYQISPIFNEKKEIYEYLTK